MNENYRRLFLFIICGMISVVQAESLESGFANPPEDIRPETWFHLIGGNVSKAGLTVDLEAIAGAGISGIQLFHGSGKAWPNIEPQITCLSPSWDNMIGHVADETQRLGLRFTMQNCPGWAMSGGPWITPDKAMRHLIWSRRDIQGGSEVSIPLAKPQPSNENWRDYRDVAVLAFPTPKDDTDRYLIPTEVRSNRPNLPWMNLIKGVNDTKISIMPDSDPVWVEVIYSKPVILRSIELPPVELLMKRRHFDPDTTICLQALTDKGLVDVMSRKICRGNWQDRLPEIRLTLAFADYKASGFRLTFNNHYPLELSLLGLSSAARINNWQGQAGYALRSLERELEPVQDLSAWIKADSIVDLSDAMEANGQLTWKVPVGKWTVVRFGHVNTGVKNKPAPPEATGFECDKLSPAGAEQHFAGYIGRLTAQGGPAEGRLKGMVIDSWECYTQTWTPAMEKEFVSRRGYALRSWLPALAGWVIEDHLTSERFLRDWRATINDLLVDNYFGRLAELAKQRGLKLSFETAIGDVSPGDILQYYSKTDIPMCEFWQPNDPHWGGLETKPIAPATSAAHVYGKQRIAAEAFTNINIKWNENPFMFKHLADYHFTMGINHLVFHTYTHNPDTRVVPGTSFGGRIGTPFLCGQTWWQYMPQFTGYLSRCQFMLEQGWPVADVLWYLGDDLDHKPRQDSPFPKGYRFDYLNQDALLNRIRLVDGKLTTPEGVCWQVLWVPDDRSVRMTPATLGRLKEILHDGAIIISGPPCENASLSGAQTADIAFGTLVRELWGQTPAKQGNRRLGLGRLIWGTPLESVLAELDILPDVVGPASAAWCHRQYEDTDIYFVVADRVTPLQANIKFRAKGQPHLWDPMTGNTHKLTLYNRQGNYTAVPLNMPAAGSMFVIFHGDDTPPFVTRIDCDGEILVDDVTPTLKEQKSSIPPFGFSSADDLQPWVDNPQVDYEFIDDGSRLLVWKNGQYRLTLGDKEVVTATVSGANVVELSGPWTLSFPAGWDTPAVVDLPELKAWSALDDPATRAFSGLATYHYQINLDMPGDKTRLLLDLGKVCNIAEVSINEKPVSILWAAPFRTDITPFVVNGANHIIIKVTNTWHNRLVYEHSLPDAQRKTWTYNQPKADTPLEEAGLTGPVRIHVGKIVELPLYKIF